MRTTLFHKCIAFGIVSAFVVQLASCGTLMYPERKGQKDGKVDAQVAILDGIGLLFFLIPGVIAFAVDFSNGTIYLPGTQTTSFNWHDTLRVVKTGTTLNLDIIESIVEQETGLSVDLKATNVRTKKIRYLPEIETKVASLPPQKRA